GDVLFQGSIGRTDLPGGDFGTLIASIERELLTLPDSTIVYSGHGPETTVGRERRTNPFLTGAYRLASAAALSSLLPAVRRRGPGEARGLQESLSQLRVPLPVGRLLRLSHHRPPVPRPPPVLWATSSPWRCSPSTA